jgi:hypothetical protein
VLLPSANTYTNNRALLPDDVLPLASVLLGSPGYGKSKFAELCLMERIRRARELHQPLSIICFDPKTETNDHLLALAEANHVNPSDITLVDVRSAPVGWNPFLDGDPDLIVRDLVTLLEASATTAIPRTRDVFTSAATVIAEHRLSFFELIRFLTHERYRMGLLRTTPPRGETAAYREAKEYFLGEFAACSKAERAGIVAPTISRLREILRSSFLRALTCCRESTFKIGSVFERPQIVAVTLNRADLGDEAARLLSCMLTQSLYREALRRAGQPGTIPCQILLEELPQIQKLISSVLIDIIITARSLKQPLAVITQHLEAISGDIRAAILANAATLATFRLGAADAKHVAAEFAVGTPSRLLRAEVQAEAGGSRRSRCTHPARHRGPLRPASTAQQCRLGDLSGRST